MCGKKRQHATLVQVYVPKLSQKILNCESAILIGTFSIQAYSNRKYAKYGYQCVVSIFGAYRNQSPNSDDTGDSARPRRSPFSPSLPNANTSTKSLSPHALGTFGKRTNEDFLHHRQELTFDTESDVWITFSESGSLEEVLLHHGRVSLGDVILLEYDPYPLSRCLIMSPQQKLIGIPNTLLESFTLVSIIPDPESSEGKDFCRLIPLHVGKRRKQESWTSVNEWDNGNDPPEAFGSDGDGAKLFPERNAISRSLGIEELGYKCSLLRKLLRTNHTWVVPANIISLVMLDVFIGTLLTLYLRTLLQDYGDYDKFCKVVLELLMKLLDWLSGAPAGLKLNAELNSLFHSFYSYHLHLWGGYMQIMEPFLKILFHGVVHTGYIGLTIQLAMTKDLLSLTTFHIYCLYIYATRLFYIELNTLKSLGRLIMGRKWNPLRLRIDSVTLSLSELFLGAFGFTVALFLLPTICIYYVVFLALRLPIVFLELLLKFIIKLFDSLEIVTAFLIFTNSEWISNEAYLNPIGPEPGPGPTLLRYEIRTQTTSRGFYKVPSVRKIFLETISKIMESRVITQ